MVSIYLFFLVSRAVHVGEPSSLRDADDLRRREMEFYANAQDTSLLHLALGLAGDLGLARAPEDQIIPTSTESVADAPTMKVVRGINVRVVHTHADRRAMLGVFYLTSK